MDEGRREEERNGNLMHRGLGLGRPTKSGAPQNGLCGGVWGTSPGNFEILHALKCVLGAPEALFRACTQYIYTCKLPSSISGSD